jgi:transcriptional regulator of NAD metabolism
MRDKSDKVLGKERRDYILSRLKTSDQPLTGRALADETNVSRQVIVQDISLLKASGEPIIATSRGYVYLKKNGTNERMTKVVAVRHRPEDTKKELYTLVDHGVTVKNVIVEHPLYGDLTGSLMLQNRRDVDDFLAELAAKNAALLSDLTGGIHLHTLEADSAERMDQAVAALKKLGFLLE